MAVKAYELWGVGYIAQVAESRIANISSGLLWLTSRLSEIALSSSSDRAESSLRVCAAALQDGFESARDSYNTSTGMQALLLDNSPKRRLASLSLAGCCQITGKGLQALSKACSKSMRQLNISRTMVSSLQLLTRWVGLV